jgi:hypothetical protein
MELEELEARIKDLEHSDSEIRQILRIAGATIEGMQAGIAALTSSYRPASYRDALAAATLATDTLNAQMAADDNDDEYQQIARAALDGVLRGLIFAAKAEDPRNSGPASDQGRS